MQTVTEKNPETRQKKQKPQSTGAKLGWSREDTEEIANVLNNLLANYSVHYQKLRNYHWNVKGGDFFDLHEQFEQQYNEAKLHIDEIAERIRVFGMTPLSTMQDYLETSELKETGTDIDAETMVEEILNDFRTLLKLMDDVVTVANERSDSGTEEIMKGFIRKVEKHHWMLSAFNSR